MRENRDSIRDLLRRARRRWRTLAIFRGIARGAAAASAVVALALATTAPAAHAPLALAAIVLVAFAAAVAAAAWGLAPLRRVPSDLSVARYVEERASGLEDRLVSAVDAMTAARDGGSPTLADVMVADAARHARDVDLDTVVPTRRLRRAGLEAAAALLALGAVVYAGRGRAREGFDAASLALFPAHVRLEVVPGNARIRAGTPLRIEARLVGNRAPVPARVDFAEGEGWRAEPMTTGADGGFALSVGVPGTSFRYRVVAGPATSATYAVTVVRPPQVTRIDVDYTFPPALGLGPRTDEDSGDIYAPAGTDVRVRIHTDRPAAAGRMVLADGRPIPLAPDGRALVGALKVVDDNSYRVALSDAEGLSSAGDTEYYIRRLEERPPVVRVVKPAADRSVTSLEEVDVEAQADGEYAIDRLDLVYSVRGGPEQVAPFSFPRRQTSVTGHRTMYLEDLKVRPGDLISYYIRARDVTRGRRSNEAKSDIFFLEVKPYDQEFSLAQSLTMAGAGGGDRDRSIDDLVTAQKQVVVATWKLDQRSQRANATPEQDIRSVSRAEADLKTRVEQTSGAFSESVMRDPQHPRRGPGRSATKTLPEEDDMAAAAAAMQSAVGSLDALKTRAALPPEMLALNHLLKAQSEVKKRQIAQQQSGAGRADNNRNYDLSTLFDKDLQKNEQTNYETPTNAEQRQDPNAGALDRVRDLARRQDELFRRQQELAARRGGMTEEEVKRQLEKLTRDQLELRQKTEELAKKLEDDSRQSASRQSTGQQSAGRQSQSASQQANGQQANGQQASGQQSSGQQAGRQSAAADGSSRSARSASDEMQAAAGDLRRNDTAQASAAAGRALERLRELERRLQQASPDERRRALGDMQLEARQLADTQRELASQLGRPGGAATDSLRRASGEQARLADRVRRLQQGLEQQASAGKDQPGKNASASAGEASRELEREHLADRMQQAAGRLRQAADGNDAPSGRQGARVQAASPQPTPGRQQAGGDQGTVARAEAGDQQEMAHALDKLADRLAAATGSGDADSQKLSERLARAEQLRDRLSALTKQMQEAASQRSASRQSQSGSRSNGSGAQATAGETGQEGRGESGGSSGGNDLARLRDEYARDLQQARDLLDELHRDDPTFTAQHGVGFTFEGQGMVLSAPGTEAFKQDFAQWEELRRQATQALDAAQLSLSKQLEAKEAHDRLTSGVDDRAPAQYQAQVDSYFKAIASRKKP